MSVSDFKGAGLTKLTADELANLNLWLTKLAETVEKDAGQPSTASYKERVAPLQPASDAIESQIDGDFEGWSGETIFKLQNGQIWQQASYDYQYEYAYSPEVTIYKTSECYKMKVENVSDVICVKRLK